MKYLKKFESIDFNDIFSLNGSHTKKEELKDFCETYLAYLMDDCINELIVSRPTLLVTKYVSYNVNIYFNKNIHWIQIKDYFLPFLQMIQKEYGFREYATGTICSINWRVKKDDLVTIPKRYTLKELLDDKIQSDLVALISLEIIEEVNKD